MRKRDTKWCVEGLRWADGMEKGKRNVPGLRSFPGSGDATSTPYNYSQALD